MIKVLHDADRVTSHLGLLLLLAFSVTFPVLTWSDVDVFFTDQEYVPLDETIDSDPDMSALIAQYAKDLDRVLDRQLTVSTAVMPVEQPESAIGNLCADILLSEARRHSGKEIDIALMNHRGLRITLPKGPITVRTIFELMPFENNITLLKFTGAQIQQLAHEIAAYGGEPISGMRMRIDGEQGRDVTVGDEPLDPEATYWLATNVWMANGGGEMPTLWEPQERIDLPALIRDSFIEYLDQLDKIEPQLDGRIKE